MENYKQGKHYSRFLTVDPVTKTGTRVTKVKKTNYGYRFEMFNSYVTLYKGKIVINQNGTAKLVMKVERNYCGKYQYTSYFDRDGREIVTPDNSTRKELLIYKKLQY